MKFTIANSLNLCDVKDVVKRMNKEFTSHEFIFEFGKSYPEAYEAIKSRYDEIGKAHAIFGKYLSRYRYDLNIESKGKKLDMNIYGRKSASELWRKVEYVIDKTYDFGTIADGARPSSCGESGVHLRFEHDEVMEMGEYFHEEDPYEIDYDYNFGIKEILDAILADELVKEIEEEWEADQADRDDDCDEDEAEEKPDFYEFAYEQMSDMYHCWDPDFKQDCIDYYLAHNEE